MSATPLLLAENGIRRTPPKDRPVWLVANIVTYDEGFVDAQLFEGWAEWDKGANEWVTFDHLVIRGFFDARLHILDWQELAGRAAGAPESEIAISAAVYFWGDEWRQEQGIAGYFACFDMVHQPTHTRLANTSDGPFATQAEARNRLACLLTLGIEPKARAAA